MAVASESAWNKASWNPSYLWDSRKRFRATGVARFAVFIIIVVIMVKRVFRFDSG